MDAVVRLSNLAGPLVETEITVETEVEVPIQRQNRLKPEEVDQLVDLYESGMSVNQLAKRVKIHRTTVMRHLKRRGVQTRPAVRKLTDEQARLAGELYETGISLKNVATQFGVDPETVRKEMIALGIDRRTTAGWSSKSDEGVTS